MVMSSPSFAGEMIESGTTVQGGSFLVGKTVRDLFTYEDPENADIISVSERRRGLPVTLGVFYLHAGRACGLDLYGVDFPGHFLLRIETEEGPLALDPFSEGRVVLPSELTRIVRVARSGRRLCSLSS